MEKEIAECVGLWLAEGNNKCNNELTFTNSSPELIRHFHKNIHALFPNRRIRIYTYSELGKAETPIITEDARHYFDKRARKPYFIWRMASVKDMRTWKDVVYQYLNNPSRYPDILRGFFAGEGNIKTGTHNCRTLRIAQKERKPFIDEILTELRISSRFRSRDRSYYITGKWNWDIFNELKLAELHPEKREKFKLTYADFKENHFRAKELRKKIINVLNEPHTAKSLGELFHRSRARCSKILILLKKEGITTNFRVKSKSYWIKNDTNKILISTVKKQYLDLLDKTGKTTAKIASELGVDSKTALKRLRELIKLNLIKRETNKNWHKLPISSEVIVL